MRGTFNGYAINSGKSPSWVISAAATAIAAAAIATAAPTRLVYASASGVAQSTLVVPPSQVVLAASANTSSVASSATAGVVFKGAATGNANAWGSATIIRYIPASAGNDATSFGTAIPMSKLGEAQGTGSASAAVTAHIRFKSKATVLGTAVGQAAGDVVRYAKANATAGGSLDTWAEATLLKQGEVGHLLDGFVRGAWGRAVGHVEQDKTSVLLTLGAFDYGTSYGSAEPIIKYTAAAIGESTSYSVKVAPRSIYKPKATNTAAVLLMADATVIKLPAVNAAATCDVYSARASINYSVKAVDNAVAFSSVSPTKIIPADSVSIIGIATGNASASLDILGYAEGNASCDAEALAVTNADVLAHATRYMLVPAANRSMVVESQEYIMGVNT